MVLILEKEMTGIPDTPSGKELPAPCRSCESSVAGSVSARETPSEARGANWKPIYYALFSVSILSNIIAINFIWSKAWYFDAFFWTTFTLIAILIYLPLWLRHLKFLRPAASPSMRLGRSDPGTAKHIKLLLVITASMIPVVMAITAFMTPSIMWLISYLSGRI
jgi:hypothetical protein